MNSKIIIPQDVCDDEIIGYIATRHNCLPQDIISRFLMQDEVIRQNSEKEEFVSLEENEMEILRDMGLRPTSIEFI
ncbi:MAG: hypothetical protein NC421_02765 [Lachnospiraceae bacterium]|nr:hypothetical protein [Lachnospiraceae bacterium]